MAKLTTDRDYYRESIIDAMSGTEDYKEQGIGGGGRQGQAQGATTTGATGDHQGAGGTKWSTEYYQEQGIGGEGGQDQAQGATTTGATGDHQGAGGSRGSGGGGQDEAQGAANTGGSGASRGGGLTQARLQLIKMAMSDFAP